MNVERLVEQMIKEAMDAGEFDDLEGAGRPVDLTDYFAAPAELRAGQAVLKNANVVPEEMQLRRDINRLRQQLEACREDDARRDALRKSIAELTLKYDLLVERNRQSK